MPPYIGTERSAFHRGSESAVLQQRPNTFARTNLPTSLFARREVADHTFTSPHSPGFTPPLTQSGGHHETTSEPTLPDPPLPLLLRKRANPKGTAPAPDGRSPGRGPTPPSGIPGTPLERGMRRLLDRKIVTQKGICALCKEGFTNYSDVVPDHIYPRGMGGAWRDDHPDNIQAVHWWCNGEKGSTKL